MKKKRHSLHTHTKNNKTNKYLRLKKKQTKQKQPPKYNMTKCQMSVLIYLQTNKLTKSHKSACSFLFNIFQVRVYTCNHVLYLHICHILYALTSDFISYPFEMLS